MKRKPGTFRKPPPSGYQKLQRRMTIKLIVLFVVLALAVAAGFYFYQRHNLLP